MPAGQEGKHPARFLFCASTVEFSRCGGARGGVFWWIATVSGGAFGICMPVGREGKWGEYFLFAVSPLNFPGPGGVIFWQISTIGGGAFGRYMPTCRKGERTNFFFSPTPFHFPEPGVHGIPYLKTSPARGVGTTVAENLAS